MRKSTLIEWNESTGEWILSNPKAGTAYVTFNPALARISVHSRKHGWQDHPFIHNSRIYYDAPERVPAYVKDIVRSLYFNDDMFMLWQTTGDQPTHA